MQPSRSHVALLASACLLSCAIFWHVRLTHWSPDPSERWVGVVLSHQLGNQLWMLASSHGIAAARKARWCVVYGDWRSYMDKLEWTAGGPPHECPAMATGIPGLLSTWSIHGFTPIDNGDGYALYSDVFIRTPATRIQACGFLQSYKYFDRAVPLPFRLKATIAAKRWVRARQITAAIHVRRGDKILAGDGIPPPLTYYSTALHTLRALFPGRHRFVVVTDDPAWAYEHSLFRGMHVLSSRDDPAFDMAVISQCKHKIISIGTFGWWGAFLADTGGNRSSAVIYPVPQMPRKLEAGFNNEDYFPPHWTSIDLRTL